MRKWVSVGVKQATQMIEGKACFANPNNLSQFVLMFFRREERAGSGQAFGLGS
jgi:hypothetical protein